MRRIHDPLLAASLLVSTVTAQGRNKPKEIRGSFFPQNYTQEYFVDIDALQDTDLWDAVERTAIAGMMFAGFRQEFGNRMRDLKTIRGGSVYEKVKDNYVLRDVVEFRGTKPFKLPSAREDGWTGRNLDRIAGFPVLEEAVMNEHFLEMIPPRLFVLPRPLRMVFGNKRMVESVLHGKRRGGVPHPGLFAMTAGQRPLAYIAGRREKGERTIDSMFEKAWMTGDDPITYHIFRLYVDRKTEDTIVSMTVRFTDGKNGPSLLREGLAGFLEKWLKDKRAAFVKDLMAKVEFRIDGTDLIATVSLGGPKDVSKLMMASSVLPFVMWFRTVSDIRVAQLEAVQEVEVKEVELVEEDVIEEVQKKGAKNKGAKKGTAKKTKQTGKSPS